MTLPNAPQSRLTRVCTEAAPGHDELAACSGGWCRCKCHIPELDPPPVEAQGPADGRFVAPRHVLADLQAIRAARRAKRRSGR